MIRIFLACSIALIATAPAWAAMTYTGQLRAVGAAAGPNSDSQNAPDFAPWGGSVDLSFHPHEFGGGDAAASQSSFLLANEILMVGSVTASAFGSVTSTSASLLHVSFNLSTESIYASHFTADPTLIGSSEFVRYGPFGQPIEAYGIESAGLLPAGDYQLNITFGASVAGIDGEAGGAYTYGLILFPLPEPSTAMLTILGILFGCAMRGRDRFCR